MPGAKKDKVPKKASVQLLGEDAVRTILLAFLPELLEGLIRGGVFEIYAPGFVHHHAGGHMIEVNREKLDKYVEDNFDIKRKT